MDRIRVRQLRCADYTGNVQVAINASCRTNAYRFVCESHMKGMAVRFGKDGNRLDAHFFAGKDNPESNLTTIRDKYFLEHG